MTNSSARFVGVAAAALILGAGCLSSSPAEHTSSPAAALTAAERSQLTALEARPLVVPQMPASDNCPAGPQSRPSPFGAQSSTYLAGTGGTLYGGGPVYLLGGPDTTGKVNTYFDVTMFTDPTVSSVVLVRGQELGGSWKVVAVGPWAAGTMVGSDNIDGRQQALYSEIVLPADHPRTKSSLAPGWSYWEPRIGIDKSVEPNLCVGFQVDTLLGTEVFVVD